MIENPIYGGAYAYGKTTVAAGYDAAGVSVPPIQWTTRTISAASGSTDARLKKPIVRIVVHEVIADVVHSEIRLPRQRNSTSADVIAAVRQLVLIANADVIAGILNRNGLLTGYGNRWTRERVSSLRSHHRIAVYKPADDGIEPWLNLSKAAKLLHVAPRTLRLAAGAGDIESIHPLLGAVDLQPCGSFVFIGTRNYRARAAEPEIPHGIASRSAKASSLQSHSQMGVVMRGCSIRSRFSPRCRSQRRSRTHIRISAIATAVR